MARIPITVAEYNRLVINSIKDKYPKLRQESKGATFALNYQGTAYTLEKNLKFKPKQAQAIYEQYHELYKVSNEWLQKQLQFACENGYVECAFGLKVRTPCLYKANLNNLSNKQRQEARTAGNALGQSWGLLNDRSMNEFMDRVDKNHLSELILPLAKIHDSQYYLVKDDPELLEWVNKNLIECIIWQEDPKISHPTVHLKGDLSVFYPTWADEEKYHKP